MFSKIVSSILLVSTLAVGATSKPLPVNRGLALRTDSHSFNNWGGHASLSNFDNFYGVDNFDGSHFSQTIVEHDQQLVCHTQQIEIIQQRLVVLQEMAKRIVTEQICEVETQTIIFEQFHSSLGGFSHDLRRNSGHQVGYDRNIASHFGSLLESDGSLSSHDFGFSGHDIGSQTVVVSGSNWNDISSPASVNGAFNAARDAYLSLHPDLSS
ncbi:hypothetical protein Hypma_000737 [Hypsizygus marmoreus]|uniref:Uncharacterized protein n=1 Tax=Hypsizygus marmoreus TaxID=39966 RepID=A0A369J9K7_HYPMA|nr:hypothetical protein Hypma_000737 [Hypsizygus marmoreus]